MLHWFSLISLALAFLPSSITINGFPTLHAHTLIYKYCSPTKLDGANGTFSSTREGLIEQLLPRASESMFYRTAVLAPDQQLAVWGQFECRRDLTLDKCHACVSSFSSNDTLRCGESSLAARIQLSGCHVQYEADGSEIPGPDLTHTTCGGGDGRDAEAMMGMAYAMEALESGVVESQSGYYSVEVGGVYAAAQCAAGISGCDCGECVGRAAAVAAEECAGSLSGHVYVDLCFLRFEFHPEEEGRGTDSNQGKTGRGIGYSGKLVAIAAGGVALVLIGFVLLKKSLKKDDGDYS